MQTGAVPIDLPVRAYSVARIGVDGRCRSLVVGLQVSTLLSGDENKLILVYRGRWAREGVEVLRREARGKEKRLSWGRGRERKEKRRNVTVT